MAIDVVPAARDRAGGGATAAFPTISTLVPAAAVCIAASAYVSTLLSYYAVFGVSLVCFAHAVWPDRVGSALVSVDAYARQQVSVARADLEADLRRLRGAARGHPATAPVYAGAEDCARHARAAVAGWADSARRRAEAKWNESKDAACAARFMLRLIALVARLAAAVLFDAACGEARAWAPSVLGYLRGVADGIRPPSCNRGEGAAGGLVLKDVVCLVGTGFYLLFTMHLLFSSNTASGTQLCAVCFAATCGLAMLISDWIDLPDDADDSDTTTTYDSDAAGETSRDEELEVRESWRFLWVLVRITYCVDAFLLHVTLGPHPTTLAILALCNLAVLKAGSHVQLTPDDGERAAEGAVNKWRRGAMVVYAASSVMILVIYRVLDCYLAALGFFWLFVMAGLLLAEEDNLLDFDTTDEDEEDGESVGFEVNVTGGAEREVDEEAREEHSNTNPSDDEEGSSAHLHSSKVLENVEVEEQRHEVPDCGGGGSTDDGWELIDVDPEMPAEANCSANRRAFSTEARRVISWVFR